jgi:hypothetical protein
MEKIYRDPALRLNHHPGKSRIETISMGSTVPILLLRQRCHLGVHSADL